MKNTLLPLLFWLLFFQMGTAQESEQDLNLFLDCTSGCDINFIKNEIQIVNYVRNVQDADIYVQIASLGTGSGGSQTTIRFDGQGKWKGQNNEVVYSSASTNSSDENRQEMVKHLKVGLMPFIAQTPNFQHVKIQYDTPPSQEKNKANESSDRWNNWVYSTSVSGFFKGQARSKKLNLKGEVMAQRVTEKWKIKFILSGSSNKSQFKIKTDDGVRTDTYLTKNIWFNTFAIRAINDHWSAGSSFDIFSSSYSNIDTGYDVSPAIEYNLFPYKESTQRQLRIAYRTAYRYHVYRDTTIYNKIREGILKHRLIIAYETKAKWGSVSTSLTANQFWHDLSLFDLRFQTNIRIRIVKGLNFNLSGNLAWIRNQITLPKGSASEQDVLTQQRELATNYSYESNVGISYSFGSIYNNVVFPRLGGRL